MDLPGARVVVLGLGRFGGGLGAARWLAEQGAHVTVTDRSGPQALAGAVAALDGSGVRVVLGGHQGVDFAGADLLVVNPAVPLDAPPVARARAAGVPIRTEIALLLERWPGPILGVTGSNGKSTTATLAAALLSAAGVRCELGGNLGGSLLPVLGQGSADTVAVLELSSFMLELLGPLGLGPDVGVVTNITPNHLDRHGTMEAYTAAKAAILVRARAAVLHRDDAHTPSLAAGRSLSVQWFGRARAGTDLGVNERGDLEDGAGARVLASDAIPLPGRANRLDLAAATLGVSALLGEPARVAAALPAALADVRLPAHRLETVRRDRVRWVDDSASTTPESTAASLQAMGRCLLIAGGHDKGLDATPLVGAARRWARLVLTIGEQAVPLAVRLKEAGVDAEEAGTVERAVARAALLARPGETVLLSPGYSSHDQFANYEERAAAFRRAVALQEPADPLSRPAAEC